VADVKDLNAIKDLDKYLQNNLSDAAAVYRRGQLYANNFGPVTPMPWTAAALSN
jgi:hypothetical protein